MDLCAQLVANLRLAWRVREDSCIEERSERPLNLFDRPVGLGPQQCLQDPTRVRRNVEFQISYWSCGSQVLQHFPGETDALCCALAIWRAFNCLREKPCNVT